MSGWVGWALLLVIQNAAFTWVSRARNSGSYGYHAVASVCSNAIFIIQMFCMVDKIRQAHGMWQIAMVCAAYTVFTVTGSIGMHWVSIRYLEKGKRKVGS